MLLDQQDNAKVMTVKDVAHYLRISEQKVYRMALACQIPAFRVGKSWRFKQDLIDSWIQQECNQPKET